MTDSKAELRISGPRATTAPDRAATHGGTAVAGGDHSQQPPKSESRRSDLNLPHHVRKAGVLGSLVGWASAAPWRSTAAALEPGHREVTSKAAFEAELPAQQRDRPHGSWTKRRKPRRTQG